jgi:hypothetical protein
MLIFKRYLLACECAQGERQAASSDAACFLRKRGFAGGHAQHYVRAYPITGPRKCLPDPR